MCMICHFCAWVMNMFSTWVHCVSKAKYVSSRLEEIRSKVFCCPQRFMLYDEQFNFVFLLFSFFPHSTTHTSDHVMQCATRNVRCNNFLKTHTVVDCPSIRYLENESVCAKNTPFILSRLDFAWFHRMDSAVTRLFLRVFASFNVKYVW